MHHVQAATGLLAAGYVVATLTTRSSECASVAEAPRAELGMGHADATRRGWLLRSPRTRLRRATAPHNGAAAAGITRWSAGPGGRRW
jgi:hypothetical protein